MRMRFSLALVALAAGVVAVIVVIVLVQDALADGDPASDTLISQQVFLPLTVPYSLDKAGELTKILDDSKKKGFPLKVAVIARPAANVARIATAVPAMIQVRRERGDCDAPGECDSD